MVVSLPVASLVEIVQSPPTAEDPIILGWPAGVPWRTGRRLGTTYGPLTDKSCRLS